MKCQMLAHINPKHTHTRTHSDISKYAGHLLKNKSFRCSPKSCRIQPPCIIWHLVQQRGRSIGERSLTGRRFRDGRSQISILSSGAITVTRLGKSTKQGSEFFGLTQHAHLCDRRLPPASHTSDVGRTDPSHSARETHGQTF